MALTKIKADGLTADLIDETKLADNSIDSEHYNDGSIDNAHLADDAVGVAELSATGTASSSTFLRGDNSWAAVTSTTINNNADNRVITGSGTANTLEGEANLTYNGTDLQLTTDANNEGIKIDGGATYPVFEIEANRSAGNTLGKLVQKWNGTQVASINFVSGSDGTNKDDGYMTFATSSAANIATRMTIDSTGNVGIGKTPYRKLDIDTGHYVVTSSGQATNGIHLDGTAGNAGEYGGGISFACGNSGSAAIAARQGGSDPDVVGLSFFTHNSTDGSANAEEKVRIHGGGSVSFNDGICLGNGVTLSAANTMDDYEEGTYTATIYGSSTGTGSPFGMNPSNLRYTKVGRLVTVTGRVYINSSSNNPTGDARMLLPFTSASNGTGHDGQGYSYVTRYNVYSPNSDWNLVFEVDPNASYGVFLWDKPGAAWASATADGHINQNAAYYGFNFSYTVA